ncbi:MAG: hypothetical protein ACP6IS_12685 [Candidatus Asgardarchaeia archaeon]
MKKIVAIKILLVVAILLGHTLLICTYYIVPRYVKYEKIFEDENEKIEILFNRTIDNFVIFAMDEHDSPIFQPFRDANDISVIVKTTPNKHIVVYFDLYFKIPKSWSRVIVYFKRIYFTPYGNFETTINMSSYLISKENNLNISLDPFPTLALNTIVGAGIRLIRAVEANFTFRNYFGSNVTVYPTINKTFTMKSGNYTLRQIIKIDKVEAINLTRKAILQLMFVSSIRVWKEESKIIFKNHEMLFFQSGLFLNSLAAILILVETSILLLKRQKEKT